MPFASANGVVLDTSVWINLLATSSPWRLLTAFGEIVLAPHQIIDEVKRDPVSGETLPPGQDHPLRLQAQVEAVQMDEVEFDTFLTLVAATAPDALGDGEAAAIAVALSRKATLFVDERKARRIIRERYPDILVRRTVDLLCDPLVIASVGVEMARKCFDSAVSLGRMHVPFDFRPPWYADVNSRHEQGSYTAEK